MHDPSRWLHKDAAPEHLTVKFKPGVSLDHEGVIALMGAHEAVHRHKVLVRKPVHSFAVPFLNGETLARRLVESGLVEYAEPSVTLHPALTTNDPINNDVNAGGYVGYDIEVNAFVTGNYADFFNAWNISKGSAAVAVADIGSGADADHPDFAGKLNVGWNFVSANTNTDDISVDGHGTAVAGKICAKPNNAVGVAGCGFDTPVTPFKIADSGSASSTIFATAIEWILTNFPAIRIINISYAAGANDTTLANAILDAWNAGVILTAAAGEAGSGVGSNAAHYPAANTNVLGVSECDFLGRSTFSTNYGGWCSIATTSQSHALKNDGTWEITPPFSTGTSLCAPAVAACLALMLNIKPSYTVSQLRADLLAGGDPTRTGTPGVAPYGFGTPPLPGVRLNAYRACDIARGPRRCGFAGGF